MAVPVPLIPLLLLLLLVVMFPHHTASDTINICHWSGERGIGREFIVNADYPGPIPPQPHRCQCTLQRPPDSTALQTGVALVVKEANFTGNNCQQKLYMEFARHFTQSSTVCSNSQGVTGIAIFSIASIHNGEILSLTFDKVLKINDAGIFMIEVLIVGQIAIQCSTLPPSSVTKTPTPNTNASDATSNTLTEAKQTVEDRFATGIGSGIGMGLAVALCSGIVIFVVMYRRRCTHCNGSSRTCIHSSDAPPPGVTSRAPALGDPSEGAGTDDDPIDTSSSRQYEPLQGVTTSTPVTYENVQASNYESLDVDQNDPDGSILPITTYEMFHPNTHPI